MPRSMPAARRPRRHSQWPALSAVALVFALLMAGTALAATYPPHLSQTVAKPGDVVTVGPNPGDEPAGVPLAGDCPRPSARLVPRPSPDTPGDLSGGGRLEGTFGKTADGWLTFRFVVPSVDPGVYDVVLRCRGLPMTSTGSADAAGFTVLRAPATDADDAAVPDRRPGAAVVLAAACAVGFALGWMRPRSPVPSRAR